MAVGLGDLVAWWYMMVAYGLLVGKVGCVSMIVGYKKFFVIGPQFPCGSMTKGNRIVLARSSS